MYVNKNCKNFECPKTIKNEVNILHAENEEEAAFSELSYDHDIYLRYLYVSEEGLIIIKWAKGRFDQSAPYYRDNSLYNAFMYIQLFETDHRSFYSEFC